MSLLPDAVCWHEGMQLLPQHFQLQGLRAEALGAHLAQACNPWFWGVSHMEFDPSALSAGVGVTGMGRGVALRWGANKVRKALSVAAMKGLLMKYSPPRSQKCHKLLN